PAIIVSCQRFPVVQRIAPPLTGLAEVVRRHAGDYGRGAGRVKPEEMLVAPDIGRVVGDEDRGIAHDQHSALVRIAFDLLPLSRNLPLQVLLKADILTQLFSVARAGFRVAPGDLFRPLVPAFPLVAGFESHEQGIVVKPEGAVAVAPELLHSRVVAGREETLRSGLEQRKLVFGDAVKVYPVRSRMAGKLPFLQVPLVDELLEVDQKRIAGKGGEAGVGGVAAAGRPERQDLPERLAGAVQEIDEIEGVFPQGADAFRAGKGCGVQEDPASANMVHQLAPVKINESKEYYKSVDLQGGVCGKSLLMGDVIRVRVGALLTIGQIKCKF